MHFSGSCCGRKGESLRRAIELFLRRLIGAVPVLLIVVIGTFFLMEAAPGDAVDAYLAGIGGTDAAHAEELRSEWGLDRGPLPRLALYMTALTQLNFGWSTAFGRPVLDVTLERLPTTLLLMGLSTALAFGLGSFLGLIAGAKPGSWRDRALSLASMPSMPCRASGWAWS